MCVVTPSTLDASQHLSVDMCAHQPESHGRKFNAGVSILRSVLLLYHSYAMSALFLIAR